MPAVATLLGALLPLLEALPDRAAALRWHDRWKPLLAALGRCPRGKTLLPNSVAGEWVSILEASRLIGCGHGPVERMVRQGLIERRAAPRGVPSLRRASVLAAGRVRPREQTAQERARQQRAAARRLTDPPDDDRVWLSSSTAALALGLSANRVRQLAEGGRLPATMVGTKLWLRRDDVERAAAARAFRRRSQQG